jgi:Tfp pilus assembly protein PilV
MNASLRRRQRGITLVEALVGFLVLSMGVLGAARLQSWLRLNGDIARQRTEAVGLAQRDMEQVREFANAAAFDGIGKRQATSSDTPTTYTLTRTVTPASDASLKRNQVVVSWLDRSGTTQVIQLQSNLSSTAPIYSAALAISPQDQVLPPRHHLPAGAKVLSDGRSVVKPSDHSTIAWIVNSATGVVSSQCNVRASLAARDITNADLSDCTAVSGSLLSGYIRFSLSTAPDAVLANDKPMPLAVNLLLEPSPATAPRCETDTAATSIAYTCLVPQASSDGGWSGQLRIVPEGWAIGNTATTFMVCRYSADHDGNGRIDHNDEHPDRYTRVLGYLGQQNYLVVRGQATCPSAVPPHNDASLATVQHQP